MPMEENDAVKLLTEHGIKPTANRILVVEALAAERNPMSLKELEMTILTVDKSNISRALALFRAHHVVHDIEDGDGNTKYELCLSHSADDDEDMHVHFYCEHCHKTYCLWDTPIPAVDVPEGFRPESVNYMIKGLCADCARRESYSFRR